MSLKYEVHRKSFSIEYRRYGVRHRKSGPADVRKNTRSMFWYQYGKKHRMDGPAEVIKYGCIIYWIRGKSYFKEQYESEILRDA